VQDFTGTAKLALRDQLMAARRHLPLSALGERARALADHLMQAPEIQRAATVAALALQRRDERALLQLGLLVAPDLIVGAPRFVA